MPNVVCPGCFVRLTLGDDRAGTTVACPKCYTAIRIPPLSPTPEPRPEPPAPGPSAPVIVPATIRFVCPKCDKVYKADIADAGKEMVCKRCGTVAIIPGTPMPKARPRVLPPPASDAEPEDDVPEIRIPDAAIPATPPSGRALPPPLPLPPSARSPVPALPSSADSHPDLTPPESAPARPEDESAPPMWRDPTKLAASVAGFCLCCAALTLVLGVIALKRESVPALLIVVVALSFVATVVSAYFVVQLFAAKQRAIAGKRVALFFGMARLVTWEQNEGLIFLRDKRIAATIYGPKSGGGIRIIYPVLGEELRDKVPLTVQLTWFRDERVLTRESIQLVVKVALWWEVSDLSAYFYRIDQEVHALKDKDEGAPGAGVAVAGGRLAIAEVWVQTLAEACLRKLISGTSTFLIVSKRAASHLHVESSHAPRVGGDWDVDDPTPATPDVIAAQLAHDLHPRLASYGLRVDRVEVQEVQLPPAIQKAVDDVWAASTLPTKSRHEAEAQRNRLMVLVEALGRDNAALSEIVKNLPDGALLGNNPVAAVIAQLGALKPPPTPTGSVAVNVALPAPVPPPVPVSPPSPPPSGS